ncbi:MAG TPA: hypothetical protein PLM53_06805 [Spirochaetota bacterium]|nr:hypothetical protein [Spirochaetota bacterium]HPL17695.1 hypothetical protein [Spirochaetota bacterium]HQF07738.1 hypothetical protein [Spirochaetota bacterium]HQH96791.1 hypothetical protein [Spirochaetota bacterium]HRS78017.1 hypothetical protein [Spirochaetota bacterium]
MTCLDTHKIKAAGGVAALCVALMLAGYGAGLLIGSRFVESIILREGRFPLLLSRPVNQFYDVYSLINSSNPFRRLSGYYSLVDVNMVNEKFIADRYGREQFIVTQRTLLWVLSHAKDRDRAVKFYASIYKTSDDSLKMDILRYMKRLDKKYFDGFVKENKLTRPVIPD